jgi:hypothetical protein
MGDTIVDGPEEEGDAPPPTLPDGVPPARRPLPLRAIVGSLVGAIVLLAGAIVYVLFIRYVPTAREHVPGNANFAVRIEFADVVLFGPVRKRLFPLLDGDNTPAPPSSGATKSRADRIKDATGIHIHTDLRELVLASVDTTSWVLIAGGRIPRGRFVSGMEKMLKEDGVSTRRDGEILVLASGTVLAQADDGTILVGNDASIVRASIPASDEWKRLGLPERGAVVFSVMGEAFHGAAPAASFIPHASVLAHVARASGVLSLGSSPALDAKLEAAPGSPPAAFADDLNALVTDLKLVTLVLPDHYGEKGRLAGGRT